MGPTLKLCAKSSRWASTPLAKKEKAHTTSQDKIDEMHADLKKKEDDLAKKEKQLEERKEYLDRMKEHLSSIL